MAVYRTPAAERAVIEIYKKSVRKFGIRVARETLRQLREIISNLATNPQLGKLDPDYHSARFRYVRTKNRQKIFYEIHGDDVFIVMADYDRRDWKKLLSQMEKKIERDIATLQKHLRKNA